MLTIIGDWNTSIGRNRAKLNIIGELDMKQDNTHRILSRSGKYIFEATELRIVHMDIIRWPI